MPLTDAAFVNAVVTATEAKAHAVLDAGFAGPGTATDAICIAAPAGPGREEEFTGPRSWGARIAWAVHAAVHAGAVGYAATLEEKTSWRDHQPDEPQGLVLAASPRRAASAGLDPPSPPRRHQ